jgi:hypothetical protein
MDIQTDDTMPIVDGDDEGETTHSEPPFLHGNGNEMAASLAALMATFRSGECVPEFSRLHEDALLRVRQLKWKVQSGAVDKKDPEYRMELNAASRNYREALERLRSIRIKCEYMTRRSACAVSHCMSSAGPGRSAGIIRDYKQWFWRVMGSCTPIAYDIQQRLYGHVLHTAMSRADVAWVQELITAGLPTILRGGDLHHHDLRWTAAVKHLPFTKNPDACLAVTRLLNSYGSGDIGSCPVHIEPNKRADHWTTPVGMAILLKRTGLAFDFNVPYTDSRRGVLPSGFIDVARDEITPVMACIIANDVTSFERIMAQWRATVNENGLFLRPNPVLLRIRRPADQSIGILEWLYCSGIDELAGGGGGGQHLVWARLLMDAGAPLPPFEFGFYALNREIWLPNVKRGEFISFLIATRSFKFWFTRSMHGLTIMAINSWLSDATHAPTSVNANGVFRRWVVKAVIRHIITARVMLSVVRQRGGPGSRDPLMKQVMPMLWQQQAGQFASIVNPQPLVDRLQQDGSMVLSCDEYFRFCAGQLPTQLSAQ